MNEESTYFTVTSVSHNKYLCSDGSCQISFSVLETCHISCKLCHTFLGGLGPNVNILIMRIIMEQKMAHSVIIIPKPI